MTIKNKRCLYCYNYVDNSDEGEYHFRCSKRFWKQERPPELSIEPDAIKHWITEDVNKGISLTGFQPKLSAGIENQRLTYKGWPTFIVKLPHLKYEQMIENEDVTLKLATEFKIKVCEHTLLRTIEEKLVYVTRRFDRVPINTPQKKLGKVHIEDFYQLKTDWPSNIKYDIMENKKYKSSYEEIGRLIKKYCTYPDNDSAVLFDLVLFSYLVGNSDMHLKNFSLLHYPNKIISFTPAYDLLNVHLSTNDEEETALTINGKKNRIKKIDFNELAKYLSVNPDYFYKKYQNGSEKVKKILEISFLSEENKRRYYSIWSENISNLFS